MRVAPTTGSGFLTGYYEPEFEGSRTPSATYRVPLLDRPDDLVTVPQGESLPGLDSGLQAGRRGHRASSPIRIAPPSRRAPWASARSPSCTCASPAEAFILHVQGSARIRLDDGSVMRVAYAGRNGHPYTSIGKLLVQQGVMDLETMTLERLMGWLKDNPEPARALMRQNRSYIFFREAAELAEAQGPIGGAGIPLTPGRSLAVDRTIWPYGLPVFIDGTLPHALDRTEPLRRLMVAQDTGSAIVGPARGDFFVGSGEGAGTQAGLMRHAVSLRHPEAQSPIHDEAASRAQQRGAKALGACGPGRRAHERPRDPARARAGGGAAGASPRPSRFCTPRPSPWRPPSHACCRSRRSNARP